MQPETKKLGILLIEAGLITPAQLQETLRHQRMSGGRLGSTLVAQGIINEDTLMDFLAKQTGVPRLDVKNLEIPPAVLKRIPQRLAEQLSILPVAIKEPKSLVLAMADPMDLNAVDSARFASGMSIEPMVASHSSLRQAIIDQYGRLASGSPQPLAIDMGLPPSANEGLSVPFELSVTPFDHQEGILPPVPRPFPKDPFFSPAAPGASDPFSLFPEPQAAPVRPASMEAPSGIIHQRSAMAEQVVPLENYGTRALVLGLARMLQRRGILGPDELQRFLAQQVEARALDPDK